ncbi:MAG: phage terminase large subunit [Sphingomonadales bacterium]|nr:phage terminase large subunit [Sphingomonadales bacterium]
MAAAAKHRVTSARPTIRVELPPRLRPVFAGAADVRGAWGGRGSGKSRSFALMAALHAYRWAGNGETGTILCGRQFMNTLAESSMEEVKAAITGAGWLLPCFDIGEGYIRTSPWLRGRIDFSFTGLDRNIDGLKGRARLKLAWIDEAEPVSEAAWARLLPTLREEDSELWVTWNPEREDSPTHRRFRLGHDPRMKVTQLCWQDNPWFPARLDRQRRRDAEERPETYAHVWDGAFATCGEALVLRGRVQLAEFQPGRHWHGPYFGADWGFAVDPTCLVKCWVDGRRLYIEDEAYAHEVAIDAIAPLFARIAGASEHVIRGDAARPETINYVSRHGFPKLVAAEKWPGSVADGVEHLRSYEAVVIHPRCVNAFREAGAWRWRSDRLTGDVLPQLAPGDDHVWDAVRYALAPLIRRRGAPAIRTLML